MSALKLIADQPGAHLKKLRIHPSRASERLHLSVALFLILFTSGVTIPIPGFEGLPLWVPIAGPTLAILSVRQQTWPWVAIATAVMAGALATHLLVSHVLLGTAFGIIPLTRSALQLVAVSVLLALIWAGLREAESLLASIVDACKIFLAIQAALTILMIATGYKFWPGNYPHYFLPIQRVSGLLAEPSHVAVAMSVPLTLLIGFPRLSWNKFGPLYTSCAAFILIACPSASLIWPLMGAISILALRVSGIAAALIPAALLALPSIGPTLAAVRHINPITERAYDAYSMVFLGTRADTLNVSSIVLAKGVYVMNRVLNSYPLGMGIDNAYYANLKFGPEMSYLFSHLNARDSSSILLKIGIEFGWVGLLVFVTACLICIVCVLKPSLHSQILGGVALTLLVANAGRGASYFDFGFLVAIAAVLALSSEFFWRRGRIPERVSR